MSQLFYVKACSSTNDEITGFLPYGDSDFIALHTFSQTRGRGQYGNTWMSNAEKNIAYTLAVKTENFFIPDSLFNYYTAILISDFLANVADCPAEIKWPNDIILRKKKIAGMLIEKKKIRDVNYYIIGAGINVLQEEFDQIPNAGSLFSQTGKTFDLEELTLQLHSLIVDGLKQTPSPADIITRFNNCLFRRDKISVFEIDGKRQNGIIRHADEKGELWIDLENEGLKSFYHKEVKLLY